MKTRNSIEMACTRADVRWQMCREIARTAGWYAAMRAMALGGAAMKTSSAAFDAWYYGLGRIHPCAEFEEDADQFVIGDLVASFEAGREDVTAERDRLRAELDAIRSAPVAVEVPEPSDLDWQMIKDQAESVGLEYPDGFYDGIAYARRNARTCSSEHARAIPSFRILKDGEVAIRSDILSAMEGCVATLRADAELIPSKALAHLDALRSTKPTTNEARKP